MNKKLPYFIIICAVICFTEMVSCTWHAENLQHGCAIGVINDPKHCQ